MCGVIHLRKSCRFSKRSANLVCVLCCLSRFRFQTKPQFHQNCCPKLSTRLSTTHAKRTSPAVTSLLSCSHAWPSTARAQRYARILRCWQTTRASRRKSRGHAAPKADPYFRSAWQKFSIRRQPTYQNDASQATSLEVFSPGCELKVRQSFAVERRTSGLTSSSSPGSQI